MSLNDAEKAVVLPETSEAPADTTQGELKEPNDFKAVEAEEQPGIDSSFQMFMQIFNALMFIALMVFTSQVQKITGKRIGNAGPLIRLTPAGFAAPVMWAIIYFLLASFSVYQALPNKMVPSRNNHLIFGQIRFVFAVNLISNGLWLVLFVQGTSTFLGLAALDLFFMTFSQLYILMKTCEVQVNTVEFITLRIGYTIYTAWVSAATILGVSFYLKSIGFSNAETTWGIIILYVALVVYIAVGYFLRNPLFTAEYFWVLFAIIAKSDQSSILANCWVCMAITLVAVTGITIVCYREWKNGTAKKGLFYKIEMQ